MGIALFVFNRLQFAARNHAVFKKRSGLHRALIKLNGHATLYGITAQRGA